MISWNVFVDMSNVSASYIIGFIISLRFFCIFHWVVFPQPLYLYLFVVNLYACQRLVSAKRLVVSKILRKFDDFRRKERDLILEGRETEDEEEEQEEAEEQRREEEKAMQEEETASRRELLEQRLQTGIEIPEVAEFVHGFLGRIIIEIALAFLQWSMTVFHYQLISFSLNELLDNLNQTRPLGTDRFEDLNSRRAGPLLLAVFPVAAFVIFSLLSLTRSARQCGLFSFLSLLCFGVVLGLIFFFMVEESYASIDVPRYGPNVTDPVHQLLDAFSQLYLRNHRLMFTQSVGGILTVECSMVGTRHLFYYPLFVSGFAVIIIGTCFIYAFYVPFDRTILQLLLKLNSSSVITILMCLGVTFAFPLQNAPIYRVFEKRCLTGRKCCCRNDAELDEELENLLTSRQESFLLETRRGETKSFAHEDLATDLEPRAPWVLRYALRAFIVLTQIGATCIFIFVPTAFKIFCMLCMLASRFLGFMFPSATQIVLGWKKLGWMLIFDFLLMALVFTEICGGMSDFLHDWNV